MNLTDVTLWISIGWGISAGWLFIFFGEQVGKFKVFVAKKIIQSQNKIYWKTIDFLWRIALAPAVGFLFIYIPSITLPHGNATYKNLYRVCYTISLYGGALIRLPKFLALAKKCDRENS